MIMKNGLLFYSGYQQFYEMADRSAVFSEFCREAYGADLSQDGFSDIKQIEYISELIPKSQDLRILDAGCGNGKMLGFLQKKLGGFVCGFDYSENAIKSTVSKAGKTAASPSDLSEKPNIRPYALTPLFQWTAYISLRI